MSIVYILGELNADIIITGKDMMPEFNREKLLDSFDIVLGSSSAITAVNLAGLGVEVRFVSVVGDDQLGRFCMDQLKQAGIDTRYVTVDSKQKTGVTLSFSTPSDRALITYLGAIPHLHIESIPNDIYIEASHIHFGSYYLLDEMRPHWVSVFKKASKQGITTSFDTGWDLHNQWHRSSISELLKYTSYFIPSEDELQRIFIASSIDEALQHMPTEKGSVIVKRGSKGAVMIQHDGDRLEVPSFTVQPLDTTGAGDSFNAGFIYSIVSGKEPLEAMRWACACGAMATMRVGGAGRVPSNLEVERFIVSHC